MAKDITGRIETKVREYRRLPAQVENLEQHVRNLLAVADGLSARVRDLEAEARRARQAQRQDQLEQRVLLGRMIRERLPSTAAAAAPAPRTDRPSLAQALEELQRLAPPAFEIWRPLLDVNAAAYMGYPAHSCSVPGHEVAEAFCRFLRPYLFGPVLDIGCGPQPVPAYLAPMPVQEIAGIDPLDAPHPFVFAQGVAEFLPWDDGAFNNVVCATSLDHVLLLDRALDEIHRVLRPGGRFVVWAAFIPGAAPYQPYSAPTRLDEFHLFHFDQGWFEAELGKKFELEERLHLAPEQISSFYVYRKPV